jgi:hypothetical protein
MNIRRAFTLVAGAVVAAGAIVVAAVIDAARTWNDDL